MFGNNDVHGKACEALEHDEEVSVGQSTAFAFFSTIVSVGLRVRA